MTTKTNITISVDFELAEKLKLEKNYSNIINEQMWVFYKASNSENKKILKQNLIEIKQILKEKRKKQREIEKKIKQIEEREKILRCPECNRVMFNGVCHKCGIKIELKKEELQ